MNDKKEPKVRLEDIFLFIAGAIVTGIIIFPVEIFYQKQEIAASQAARNLEFASDKTTASCRFLELDSSKLVCIFEPNTRKGDIQSYDDR